MMNTSITAMFFGHGYSIWTTNLTIWIKVIFVLQSLASRGGSALWTFLLSTGLDMLSADTFL